MILQGRVAGYDGEVLTVTAPCPDVSTLLHRRILGCEIRLDDGRTISADQRKKIYAKGVLEYLGIPYQAEKPNPDTKTISWTELGEMLRQYGIYHITME